MRFSQCMGPCVHASRLNKSQNGFNRINFSQCATTAHVGRLSVLPLSTARPAPGPGVWGRSSARPASQSEAPKPDGIPALVPEPAEGELGGMVEGSMGQRSCVWGRSSARSTSQSEAPGLSKDRRLAEAQFLPRECRRNAQFSHQPIGQDVTGHRPTPYVTSTPSCLGNPGPSLPISCKRRAISSSTIDRFRTICPCGYIRNGCLPSGPRRMCPRTADRYR